MNNNLTLLSHLFIVLLALFAITYTFGIVWRVEKKLDISFKFFLVAIISFTLSEITSLTLPITTGLSQLLNIGLQIIFIVFFLAGVLEMRSMLRRMDGEIKK